MEVMLASQARTQRSARCGSADEQRQRNGSPVNSALGARDEQRSGALEWHHLFCSREGIPLQPVPADVLLSAIEDYDIEAPERSLERAAKKAN
jgi:hypothetical protein